MTKPKKAVKKIIECPTCKGGRVSEYVNEMKVPCALCKGKRKIRMERLLTTTPEVNEGITHHDPIAEKCSVCGDVHPDMPEMPTMYVKEKVPKEKCKHEAYYHLVCVHCGKLVDDKYEAGAVRRKKITIGGRTPMSGIRQEYIKPDGLEEVIESWGIKHHATKKDLATAIRKWMMEKVENQPIKSVRMNKHVHPQSAYGFGYRQAKEDIKKIINGEEK
jgi:hypothetical protein